MAWVSAPVSALSIDRKKIAMAKADACSGATAPVVRPRMKNRISSGVRAWPSRFFLMISRISMAVFRRG